MSAKSTETSNGMDKFHRKVAFCVSSRFNMPGVPQKVVLSATNTFFRNIYVILTKSILAQ